MAETIFWWIFTAACGFGSLLAYGMVEDLFRQRLNNRGDKKEKPAFQASGEAPDTNHNGHSDPILH